MNIIVQAWRNIWRNRQRTWIVALAAIVGIFGINMGIGFMNGMFSLMIDGAIQSGLGHVQVRPADYLESRSEDLLPVRYLSAKPYEPAGTYSAARLEKSAILRAGVDSRGVQLLGIDADHEQNVSRFDDWLVEGQFLSSTERGRNENEVPLCLIGWQNVQDFDLILGDSVVVTMSGMSGDSISTRCQVWGIFKSPSEPIDKYTVLIDRRVMAQLLSLSENSAHVRVYLGDSLDQAKILADTINEEVSDSNLQVAPFQKLEPGISRLLEMSVSSSLIFYIILLTGFALVLINTVHMSVAERRRELGILKAIGTPVSRLMTTLVLESLFVCAIGAVVGSVVSALWIQYLHDNGLSLSLYAQGMELMAGTGSTIYPFLKSSDLMQGLLLTLFVAILASIWPARQILKLRPVEAIYGRD